jgi:hypothetical protein
MKLSLGVATLLLATGCAGIIRDTVVKRATFDLDCAAEQIQVVEVGPRQFGTSGCGKRAVYSVKGECSTESSCVAKMDSKSGTAP